MVLRSALESTATVTQAHGVTAFTRHLDADWIDEALAATGMATLRRRRLPMDQTVRLVIGMALLRDRPIADVARQLDLALPAPGSGHTVAPSAIPQARARLGPKPIEWLFLRTATQWGHESARRNEWRGLALYGADGTTHRVADSDENRAHFGGQSAGKRGRGRSGYPQVRLVAAMALRSHVLVAASFGPYSNDERTYATDLWTHIPDNSLTVLDRLYLQANVMVPLQRGGTNRHWLMRAKKSTRWRVLDSLGRGDSLVEMSISGEARRKDPSLPKTIVVRAIAYQRAGFAPQTLLTSLTDAKKYPAKELVALYHERWEIELGYDEIKTELLDREETIRSKSPAGVEQELWGILLAYNLVRVEMESIASDLGVEPTRISFVAALRFVVDEWSWASITASPGAIPRHLQDMRDKIRRFLLPPRRPTRSAPRAVKIKMSSYPLKRSTPLKKRPI